MKNRPTTVGVTGGIGSGKSTICKIFEVLGCKTYYADDRAKWLMENDPILVEGVKSLFGPHSYSRNKLDRKMIAEKVFKDASLLDQLNALVHPSVKRDFEKWGEENKGAEVLLKEAALLFETGSYKDLDKMILVTADEKIRIDRVVKRDPHRSEENVKDIINKQMSDEEKLPLADFVISNSGEESVIAQVMKIRSQLI